MQPTRARIRTRTFISMLSLVLFLVLLFLSVVDWSVTAIADLEPVNPVNYNDTTKHYDHVVKVFHLLDQEWGKPQMGPVPCGSVYCEWYVASKIEHLAKNLATTPPLIYDKPPLTLGVYNLHTLRGKDRSQLVHPRNCELKVNRTIGESEESLAKYSQLIYSGRDYFDGYSTTHPSSSIQRIYRESLFEKKDLMPRLNFSSLIAGGVYIGSNCNSAREKIVLEMRRFGLRVDGLGNCLKTVVPEGVEISHQMHHQSLDAKRAALNRYMFYTAFENTMEPGYVTEKPFDGLIAGTVPIYLGDSTHLKTLIPHPKSVIFLADFNDTSSLVQYLKYLVSNESAYEEHRSWYHTFDYQRNIAKSPLMAKSWYCRVCEWGLAQQEKQVPQKGACITKTTAKSSSSSSKRSKSTKSSKTTNP